ncbi:2686_t:CDS:2, partial [Ambispora gerdemannii]
MDEICKVVPSQRENAKLNVRRVVTIFLDDLHHLQKFVDHNHSSQASSAEEIHPYISLYNALCMKIKRTRSTKMPSQPKTLDEINIPDSLFL